MNLSKLVAVVIALNLTQTNANADSIEEMGCQTSAGLAYQLMTNRQKNISQQDMLGLLESKNYEPAFEVEVRAMLNDVYLYPIYSSQELRDKAAIDFRNFTLLECQITSLKSR